LLVEASKQLMASDYVAPDAGKQGVADLQYAKWGNTMIDQRVG